MLLWRGVPFGYVAAAGLLLVSALGGVVFAVAAVIKNVDSGPATEPARIIVRLQHAQCRIRKALLALDQPIFSARTRQDTGLSQLFYQSFGRHVRRRSDLGRGSSSGSGSRHRPASG